MQLTVSSTEPVVVGSLGKIPLTTNMIYIPYVIGCGSFNFFIPASCLFDLNFLVGGNPLQFELAPMPSLDDDLTSRSSQKASHQQLSEPQFPSTNENLTDPRK